MPEIPKIPGMPSWLGGTFCLCVGGWWAVMRSRTESCSGGRGAMKNQNQNRSPRRVRMWMLTGSEESTAEGAGEKPSSAGIQVRSHMHARGGCQHGAASISCEVVFPRVGYGDSGDHASACDEAKDPRADNAAHASRAATDETCHEPGSAANAANACGAATNETHPDGEKHSPGLQTALFSVYVVSSQTWAYLRDTI